ncbi:MAG TPA: hypothetical protein VMW08_11860 [Acidimicrobiales bacterium]|nr:hypothetical protein [Acidimicrobiales bacterium]
MFNIHPPLTRSALAADYVAGYDHPKAGPADALRFIASRFPALGHLPRPATHHLGELTRDASHPLADELIEAFFAFECGGDDEFVMADVVLVLAAITRYLSLLPAEDAAVTVADIADDPDVWWFLAEVASCWLSDDSLAAYAIEHPARAARVAAQWHDDTGQTMTDPLTIGAQTWQTDAAAYAATLLRFLATEVALAPTR